MGRRIQPRPIRGSAAAFLLLSLVSGRARAQAQGGGSDHAAADALYDEGRELIKAGNRASGCAKFEASLALSPAASTMINIARCHEQDGKLATAWTDYTRALSLNGDTPGVERRKELEEIARNGRSMLEPRLPRLRVVVAGPPPGVEVWSDDKALPAATLGEALPADPGLRRVRVRAPGYREETRSVTLAEGKTAVVEITLARSSEGPTSGWSRPTGIAFTTAGAVGLGIGAVTGILSLNKVGAIKSRCGGVVCPADDTADRDSLSSAKTLGNVSTAALVAGGTLAAAGVVLLVIRPDAAGQHVAGGASSPPAGWHGSPPGARPASVAGSVRVSVAAGRVELEASF
jgi:hypothetical protein